MLVGKCQVFSILKWIFFKMVTSDKSGIIYFCPIYVTIINGYSIINSHIIETHEGDDKHGFST